MKGGRSWKADNPSTICFSSVFGLHAKGCTCPSRWDLPSIRIFLAESGFASKMLALGTNQTRVADHCVSAER